MPSRIAERIVGRVFAIGDEQANELAAIIDEELREIRGAMKPFYDYLVCAPDNEITLGVGGHCGEIGRLYQQLKTESGAAAQQEER